MILFITLLLMNIMVALMAIMIIGMKNSISSTEHIKDLINRNKSFFWNTVSGGISSTQSVIILFFATRYLETEYVGIFTIGYAIAVLGYTLAKYGIRTYQVTDIHEKYNRQEYVNTRIITVVSTLFITIIYASLMSIFGHYTTEKSLIIVLICGWKLIESFEDVLVGIYQQLHRLDIGAYLLSLRMGLSTILYCVLIAITKNLLTATIIVDILSVMLSVGCFGIGNKINDIKIGKGKLINCIGIIMTCFPLFVANSMNIFVGNEPKYLVDILLDDTKQAYFGYIITPAYIIGILSGFIYQPQIRDYGELWEEGRIKDLKKKIFNQALFTILAVLVFCIAGALVGIPILSWYYATNLQGQKKEFIVLIVGGGAFALTTFMLNILTIIRVQRFMAISYIVISLISLFFGNIMIVKWNILGAAILFLLINIMLLAAFVVKMYVLLSKREKEAVLK